MNCGSARDLILNRLRERLSVGQDAELGAHLSTCPSCRAHAEAEHTLSEVVEEKLPRYAAPLALKRRLTESWPESSASRRAVGRPFRAFALAGALSIAAMVLAVVGSTFFVQHQAALRSLENETINDHLRMLEGTPLAQVTGGLHEVKPWFGGRLGFAPAVQFAGSNDFPLQGGAAEPFLDRRAGVFVYGRRLHKASLFVVEAQGLAFPSRLRTRQVRGFNVVLWRANDQGYALVSDLNLTELLELQKQIAAP
jgi:anti-sigma factor RsiW